MILNIVFGGPTHRRVILVALSFLSRNHYFQFHCLERYRLSLPQKCSFPPTRCVMVSCIIITNTWLKLLREIKRMSSSWKLTMRDTFKVRA